MIISWVVVDKGGLEEDIRRNWEVWGIPSPPFFSLHPAWDISTFLLLAANSFLWWWRKKSIVFLKATRSPQKVHCFKMGWGGWVLWGERVELIPSFRLITPDVIPVVMWVTTKPTASLCPWEQRLNCYAYKDTGLLFLSLLPFPHCCRHWLLLGIPTRLEEVLGNMGAETPQEITRHFCQWRDNHWAYPVKLQAHPERHPTRHLDSVLSFSAWTMHLPYPVPTPGASKLITKQTILSSHPAFLRQVSLTEGKWEATRVLQIASKERHRPPGQKRNRSQNESTYSYHKCKISDPSGWSTSSSEGQIHWPDCVLLATVFTSSTLGTLLAF